MAEIFVIYGEDECQTATYFSSIKGKYEFSVIRCKLKDNTPAFKLEKFIVRAIFELRFVLVRRNFPLIGSVLIAVILGVNSARKIVSFRGTSEKVNEAQMRLEVLKRENEDLKNELEYKKSDEFKEMEIRNRLGLAKERETVVIVPKDDDERRMTNDESSLKKSNWQKWKELFFGT